MLMFTWYVVWQLTWRAGGMCVDVCLHLIAKPFSNTANHTT
jgi:hypothetical protein